MVCLPQPHAFRSALRGLKFSLRVSVILTARTDDGVPQTPVSGVPTRRFDGESTAAAAVLVTQTPVSGVPVLGHARLDPVNATSRPRHQPDGRRRGLIDTGSRSEPTSTERVPFRLAQVCLARRSLGRRGGLRAEGFGVWMASRRSLADSWATSA